MKLYEGKIGRTYAVESVLVEQKITGRLEALGISEQTPITIMNRKGNGTLIIKVRETRLTLGRKIVERTDMREVCPDEWR